MDTRLRQSVWLASCLLAWCVAEPRAATYTWSVDANGSWNAPANWGGTGYPKLPGDVASFTNSITADRTVTVNLAGSERVGTINLTDATPGSNWILSGGTLFFDNSGTGAQFNSSTGANSTTSNITLYDNLTVNTTGASLLLNSQINLQGYNLTVTGSGNTAIDKNFGFGAILIYGSGGIIKEGTGVLTIQAKNNTCSYTGATQVREGTLRPDDSAGTVVNPLPSGTSLILGNGTTSGIFDLYVNQTVGSLGISGTGASNTVTSTDSTTRTFTLSNLSANTYSGAITGNLNFTKSNVGSLTLGGSGGYSGTTTFGNGAAVTLDFASNNAGKLGSGATTLQGMDLSMSGNASAASSQNLNNVTFSIGRSTVGVASNGQAATLNLGTIARTAPATVAFTLPALGSITTSTGLTNGILGGWATVGTDWATKSGSDIIALPLASYAAFTQTGTNTNNELLAGTNSLTGAKTTNSLKVDTSGPSQSLSLGANSLVLSSRGLLFVGGDDYAITGTGSLGGSGNEMIVHTVGAGTLTIATPVSGGGGAFVKTGAGTVELTGTSAYTGATTVSQGTLRMGAASALSASTAVTVNSGATWHLNGNSQDVASIAGTGTVDVAGATLTLGGSSGTTFSGVLQGSGTITKTGTANLTFSGTLNNAFTGTLYVNAGNLYLNRTGYTAISGDLVVGDGTGTDRVYQDYISHQIADSATVTLNTSGYYRLYPDASGKAYETVGRLVVNGASTAFINGDIPSGAWLTVNALEMTGGVISLGESTWNPGYLILGGNVLSHASGTTAEIRSTTGGNAPGAINLNGATRTFTVADGAADADLSIGTRIQTSSGTAGIIKDGPGHLAFVQIPTVQANHTYNGPTEIREGKISIGRANHLPTGTVLTLGDASDHSGVLELNGFSQQVAGLATVGAGAANAITNSSATTATLTVNNGADGVFDGAITGPVTLTKSGSGALTLTKANTLTGTTTFNAGTLTIQDTAGLGTSTVRFNATSGTPLLRLLNDGSGNDGILAYANNVDTGGNNATYNLAFEVGPLTGNSGNTVQLGALTLNGGAGYGRTVNVTGSSGYALEFTGTLSFGDVATTLNPTTASLILNDASSTASTRPLVLSGTATGNQVKGSYASAGGAGLTKAGTGTWTLSGNSTYAGNTTLNDGALVVTSLGGLGSSTVVFNAVSPTAPLLRLQHDGAGDHGTISYGRNVQSGGGNSHYILSLDVGPVATSVGNTIELGALTFPGGAGYTRTVNVTGSAGYSLRFTGAVTYGDVSPTFNPTTANLLLNTISMTATRGFTLGGTAVGNVVSGSITGSAGITKSGTSAWVLAGVNSYTGTTTVSGGTLQFNQPASIGGTGRSVAPAASTVVAAGYAIDNAFLNRLTDNDADAYVVALAADSANSLDFGSTAGSRLTAASLGAVGGASYTGTLTPNGTTYRLGGGGGTLTLPSDGALSGARSLSVTANGTAPSTVILGGTNAYTGTTTVNSGMRLLVNGSLSSGGGTVTVNTGATLGGTGTINRNVTASGAVAPGASIGTLAVVGNVTFASGGSLVSELGRGGEADLLGITGSLDLSTGGDVLDLVSVFPGLFHGPYTLATFTGPLTGAFDAVYLDGLLVPDPTAVGALAGAFNLYYGPNSIELVPEPGALALAALAGAALAGRRRTRRG